MLEERLNFSVCHSSCCSDKKISPTTTSEKFVETKKRKDVVG
jgi:hypothetical protein